ncbi:MAG: N-acetyltransferase [Candidatus Aminicenantes bacterium]|nr:N-acetyltransferase [Candidatus Aminicenantes bacterium]
MIEKVKIRAVRSGREMREFVFFPEKLYCGDSNWVPPLWSDELKSYHGEHNPILSNSDFTLLLARRGDRVVGRNLVYVDRAFNAYYKSTIGFFGAFECLDDPEVSAILLDESEDWLRQRGMTAVRGPIHPVAESWGFLLQGYDSPPVFMAPYNPPYYHGLVSSRGYAKVKDLLAYEADAGSGYRIPDRFSRFCRTLSDRNPRLTVRRIDPRRLQRDAEYIWEISNISLKSNWGYVPLDRKVLQDMIAKLKPVLDPDAVWLAFDGGRAVGYCLGFPDMNTILARIRGRLLPFGFLHLLAGIKKIRRYRLFGLAVLPEYQNRGLDVLLYVSLHDALVPRRIRLEANYILEDNFKIRNPLEKMDLRLTKTYRIYEKALS